MAAIRQEELRAPGEARLYEFPTTAVRGRVAAEARITFLRRRVAAACLLALFTAGSALAVPGLIGGSEVTSRPGAPGQVRLKEGMTLWHVAERYAPPGSDRRAYVKATLKLNGLGAAPHRGARIKLPRSS